MKKLLFDGSMGALLIAKGLGSDSASLNVENYTAIRDIHTSYINSGANIIITNTFSLSAKEGHNKYPAEDIIGGALRAAHEAADGRDVYVAFDIGPSGLDMYPLGESTYEDAYEFYKNILILAGDRFDYILIETFTNLDELNAAVDAAKEYSTKPVFASMSFDRSAHTMFGVSAEDFAESMNKRKVFAAGVNCNLYPEEMQDVVRKLRSLLDKDILTFAQPNRGAPKMVGGELKYEMSEEDFAKGTLSLLECGCDILGGCCGSNENCIKLIREAL
ncbi:MAG: homocysteine S-methyltransferase family protein [Eubacteriaceae bacterium]|nr:homocysteine S-methyltransferase family protein [Eubacteriaceae bacterium]